ncbi:MAG: CDP-2,3-bis-(O-geranylgeranyl)-sn-glycerol synthase [Candidatus Thermoplasmatota archaeon]|jgi:CDP-2,3-bis-(O-geranylgeranyl)-sn-glycerol synthase|nr:CDP-2,3-bis-(O-geranylgeranyl)-sn-glycerol synthase [Candidatus Thermoplasmatota archaeon]MCL5964054.1 CDP-2,3-bis-(O-geranylgeranyl)-sn-glycerol synthase [Candidatus Thermoplasmatota archaeon]
MLSDLFYKVVLILWLLLPSYFANSAALLVGGGKPIDFGRSYKGNRIFGKGKTWRGFIGGISLGFLLGLLQQYVARNYIYMIVPPFSSNYTEAALIIITLSFSAMLGDLIGSFVKRRLGYKSGSELPGVDQLSFLLCTFLFTYLFVTNFFLKYFISIEDVMIAVIFTFIIHKTANVFAYLMRRKDVAW